MTFLPSPSRFALASTCAFPWSRHAPRWPRRPPSPAAAFGRAVSSVAECATVWGAAPVAEIADAHELTPADARRLADCAEHVVDALEREAPRVVWRKAEVAIAYDVERGTAREMRRAHARDYSDARPGEVSGTLDIVQVIDDGQLVVRDWKTGHRQARDSAIASDPQLRAYGLFAARAYGVDDVVVEFAHVDEGGVRYDAMHLDGFDLELCAAEVRDLLSRVERADVPVPGRHCHDRWCPIVPVCPATLAALAAIDTAASLEHPMSVEITSPEHARSVRVRLKMVREACDTIDAALKEWVTEHGPIEIAPGVLWGAVEHDGRERLEMGVPGAVAAVRRHLGDAADIAIEVSSSKAALERGARRVLRERGGSEGRGALRAIVGPLLDELREIGALRQGAPYTTVEEIRKDVANG